MKQHLKLAIAALFLSITTNSLQAQDIIINEINYSYGEPFKSYDAKDWIELYNRSNTTIDLSGWVLADTDTIFTIPNGFSLAPDTYLVLTRDGLDFADVHGLGVFQLEAALGFSSTGDTIQLFRDNLMTLEDQVIYGSSLPWPEEPSGDGPTLSLSDPSLDNDLAGSWMSSGNYGGTPGAANIPQCTTPPDPIIINEIVYKPQAFPNTKDWIELYNPNSFDVDVSNWKFVDENGAFPIPDNTIIPANDYLVLVQEELFFTNLYTTVDNYIGDFLWGLSGGGEDIALFTDAGCLVDKVDYDNKLPWPEGTDSTIFSLSLVHPSFDNKLPGSWNASLGPFGTPGANNGFGDPCNPAPTDKIVINEINYNSDTINSPSNWIELYNAGSTTVDLSGWKFYDEDSLFVIPTGTTLAADEYLVLVEDDVRFAATFPSVTNYVGPMGFGLSNNNERIMLYNGYCIIDSLKYNDDAPWPEEADGNGPTLSLVDANSDNTDPANWEASQGIGTPGAPNGFCVEPEIKFFLEGPYNTATNTMSTDLYNLGILPGMTNSNPAIPNTPAGQPYNTAPWNYAGTEGSTWGDADYTPDMVDWVMVSFRTGVENTTEISRMAAILLEDGTIQTIDRCPFTTDIASELYIVIEHRNHLGAMSAIPIPTSPTLAYDFTNKESYIGPDPSNPSGVGQAEVATGIYAILTGNARQPDTEPSYQVNGEDKNIWTSQNGNFSQYLQSDFNLDGDVNGGDKNLWTGNNGIFSVVPR